MDPNPNRFPILSFVMSRLMKKTASMNTNSCSFDIEQPPMLSSDHEHLMQLMPYLNNPRVLSSMKLAIADVAQTRSVLQTLGRRPNHESVDSAKAMVKEIESKLSQQIEEISLTSVPEGIEPSAWKNQQEIKEKECLRAAENEKIAYQSLIHLDEMHEAYENLLRDAEERLVSVYDVAVTNTTVIGNSYEAEDVVDEEVVRILQEASEGKKLEKVKLNGRQLKFFPEALGKIKHLVILDLSSNQLEDVPDAIAGLEQLEELYLSNNLLVTLPDSIGLLLHLKILNVSGNRLKALPDSISHCRSLVELDASFNELKFLPTNVGFELVNLQKLSIHLNKIRSLPSSICNMKSLQYLDAHFNELAGLPQGIGNLTNLKILNLSSNFSDLRELPPTLGDLMNLQELDLSNNQIHFLPDTFGRLDKLVKLNLDQNPLVIPPMEVVESGVEAVKEYMAKRWVDILLEEEQKSMLEEANSQQSYSGWLPRTTSWVGGWVSSVSQGIGGYLGTGEKSYKDPYLEQQL